MTKFGRPIDHSYKDMTREAVDLALTDAGADKDDIGTAFFGSCVIGYMEGQHMIPGQVALRSMGFQSIPIFNVEGAKVALHENGGGLFGYEEATAVIDILARELELNR